MPFPPMESAFVMSCCTAHDTVYTVAPSFTRFGHDTKIIHFIGSIKPWQHRYLKDVDAVILYPGTYAAQNAAQDYIRRWWQVYTSLEQVRGG